MNANHIERLYTSPLPQSQSERWAMVTGLIDHLVTPGGDSPSIVARTIAEPDNGSYAVNEAMERVGKLLDGIKGNRALPAAVPDLYKSKANALIESDVYHTLVLLHSATKPRAGHDHYASVVMALSGPDANVGFWSKVPESLPTLWEETKVALSRSVLSAPGRLPDIPAVPDLKVPGGGVGSPAGVARAGSPVYR